MSIQARIEALLDYGAVDRAVRLLPKVRLVRRNRCTRLIVAQTVGLAEPRNGALFPIIGRFVPFRQVPCPVVSIRNGTISVRSRRCMATLVRGNRQRLAMKADRRLYGTSGTAHAKLAALFGSPVPLYRATCGYGQSGLVKTLLASPTAVPVATILSGATPVSTQRSNAVRMS